MFCQHHVYGTAFLTFDGELRFLTSTMESDQETNGMFIQLLNFWTSVFSKMKVLGFVMIAMLICYSISKACESHEWRGHRIYCCNNGTAIQSKNGEKVWVAEKPEICNFAVSAKKSETSLPKIITFILITVASVCYCFWKFPFQKVWQSIQRCCKTEATEKNQKQGKEVELKVVKIMPKSQSF